MLEAGQARAASPVVFTSTGGALYGDEAPLPTAEDRIPAPLAPYGASKWAAEAYVNTWSLSCRHPQRGLPARQRLRAPPEPARRGRRRGDLQRAPVHGRRPRRCSGTASRRATTCTSRDVVSALLAACGARSGTYNIATGVETDVTTSGASCAAPPASDRARAGGPAPGRAQAQLPRLALAERELGWKAQIPIGEGLVETYEALVAEFQGAELAR